MATVEQPKPTQVMEKSLGVLGLCIIFIIVMVFFVIKPFISKLKDQNIQIKISEIEYREKKQKVDNFPTLKSEMEKNKDNIQKLSLALPQEQNIPEILIQLQTISQTSKLPIFSISPSAKEFTQKTTATKSSQEEEATKETATEKRPSQSANLPIVTPLTVSMSFEPAGFGEFLSFLQNIENNLRIMSIKTFNLSADEKGRLTSSLIFETYYQGGGQQ